MKKQYLKAAGAKVSAVAFVAAMTFPGMTTAEEVALKSYDGSTRIAGELIMYDDGLYRLETALGLLVVSASVVACDGAECPLPEVVSADFLASGDIAASKKILSPVALSN